MPPIAMKYGQKTAKQAKKSLWHRAKKICPKIALPLNVGFRTIPGMWILPRLPDGFRLSGG